MGSQSGAELVYLTQSLVCAEKDLQCTDNQGGTTIESVSAKVYGYMTNAAFIMPTSQAFFTIPGNDRLSDSQYYAAVLVVITHFAPFAPVLSQPCMAEPIEQTMIK